MKMWQWLKGNSDPVIAVATSLQVIAIICGAILVWLTKVQIEEAHSALTANTELQFQRDGRELIGSLKPEIASYIYDGKPLTNEREGQLKITQILSYYASVSRQYSKGVIDSTFWESTKRELCFFLNHDHVKSVWNAAVKANVYTSFFTEVGQKCLAMP
jgi:hypothetical protein